MNWIKRTTQKRLSMGQIAFLLSGASFLGTALGIYRVRIISANFDSFSRDAYFTAFKVPDFVFFTLASGALGVAFLPVLVDRLVKKNRQSAWELTSSLLNLLALVTLIVSVLIFIFAKPLIAHVVAPGYSEDKLDVAASLMRLLAINPFLFSISTVLTSVQQAMGRFFFYALAPLFYNGAIIASIYIFGDSMGIYGVGLGVVLGAILQLLFASIGMININFRYNLKIATKNLGFRQVMKTLPARSVDQGVDYINSIAETRFASNLGKSLGRDGLVASYENALTLHNAPTMLIGVAISTAAFPRFNERIAQGRPDLFKKEFLSVLRTMVWLSLPVVIVSYFSRAYLARLLFGDKNQDIALIFGFLCSAIFFRTLYSILSRYFYAQKDTKTPLLVSLFTIATNIILAYFLARPDVWSVAGLAMAQSIASVVEVVLLLGIMSYRDRKLFGKKFIESIIRIFSIGGFTAATTYGMVYIFPFSLNDRGLTLVTKLGLIGIVPLCVHVAISHVYGLEEAKPIVKKIKNVVFRPVKL